MEIKNRIKNGYHRGKQRYLCKNCGCNYTGSKRGYPEEVKRKAIKYYLEELGFRQIEKLIHVIHVSVINWVKKAAEEIRKKEDKGEKKKIKTKVIELDGMCVNLKKHLAKDKR